jgi:hypothetical protein
MDYLNYLNTKILALNNSYNFTSLQISFIYLIAVLYPIKVRPQELAISIKSLLLLEERQVN